MELKDQLQQFSFSSHNMAFSSSLDPSNHHTTSRNSPSSQELQLLGLPTYLSLYNDISQRAAFKPVILSILLFPFFLFNLDCICLCYGHGYVDDIFIFVIKFFSIAVYIQYYFVLVSGIQHGGLTITYITK